MNRTAYKVVFVGLAICLLSSIASAATIEHLYYPVDGVGTHTYHGTVRGDGIYYHNNQSGDNFYVYYHINVVSLAGCHLFVKRYQNSVYTEYVDIQAHGAYIFTGNSTMTHHHNDDVFRGYTDWGAGGAGEVYYTFIISDYPITERTVSGNTWCVDDVEIYIKNNDESFTPLNNTVLDISGDSYSFDVVQNSTYRLLFSDSAYYDFTCDGDEVFDYDICTWVYGYTCGIDTIKLRDNNSQLIETVYQSSGYDIYEMQIEAGEEYTISFYDMGILLCYNQTFTCTGDHVLMDFDRCQWVYPPNGPGIPIYLWIGYDYNVVIFKDNHGNMVENAELAVYDNTDDTYIQKWTGNEGGYALLGAKFDTDHDVLMMLRTFDGVFTLETTYPANGSALVGEEDITTTNWTIPIKYNLNVLPVDQYGAAMFDVFCGLSEYTPLNPQAFWGMDLSDRGYVPVTNCSGFAMCDIIAEKDGYADYKVEALNWTSRSALVKDYRHNVVMEEE